MRELKFRAWSIEKQSWVYFGIDNVPSWVHPAEVEQYTGLRDKNGKEIYEGDIIEFDKWMPNETFVRVIRGEVYWSDKGYWAVRNKDGKFLELLGRTENPEQIGNIYEHPHLLEKDVMG